MKYRRLGRTNLRVSVIGMGTWQLGGEWGKNFEQPEVDRLFAAAADKGINLIDTAECYGDHTSEQFIGRAIESRGDRDRWIIATKFGHRFTGFMKRSDERTAADAIQQVEDSLVALRTDRIDLLQYHSVRDSEFENDELTAALLKLVQCGKVRHIGNSLSAGLTTTLQAEHATQRHVEAIQIIYNRLDRRPEEKAFAICQRQDLGVLARVPLASGYLSGKYKPGARFPTDARSQHAPEFVDRMLAQVEQIRAEVPPGVPMPTWALAWCLQHPAVTCVIPGCKDVDQLLTNAFAADLPMLSGEHPQSVP
jgi:aryl-alcohol dehydrogenase-like predicted oxidoreductase